MLSSVPSNMFLRTLLGALVAVAATLPAVSAVVNTDGTFTEDVLCELEDGALGKQCGPKCCKLTPPPPPLDPAHGQRSRKACSQYAPKNNAGCGYVSNKESIAAKDGEFPYLVALGYKLKGNETEHSWLCAGGLISENFILTSANCITGARKGPEVALLGSLQPASEGAMVTSPRVQKIPIAETIVHPDWSTQRERTNDIALVRLANAARITSSVRPACLFTGRQPPLDRATIAGFGQTAAVAELAKQVNKVDVPIVSKDECNKFLEKFVKGGINDCKMICAGERGKDSCKGDSGAPLVIKAALPTCSYQVLGVTAFGSAMCGSNTPSVYTRVHAYIPWIESIVWP